MTFFLVLPFLYSNHSMLPKWPCFSPQWTHDCHTIIPSWQGRWNLELFVFGPAFDMDKIPGPVCFRMKFSSSNFSLGMNLLRVSLWHVKSPLWHMNLGTIQWSWNARSFLYSVQSMKFFCWNFVCKHLKGDGAQRFNINYNIKERWSLLKLIASGYRGQQHLQSLYITLFTDSVDISTIQCQELQDSFIPV